MPAAALAAPVVAIGFACRFNPLLTVAVAGVATGMVAGLSFHDVVSEFGRLFVENRFVTLPVILMLPVIGLLERHGLQERAAVLMPLSRLPRRVASPRLPCTLP